MRLKLLSKLFLPKKKEHNPDKEKKHPKSHAPKLQISGKVLLRKFLALITFVFIICVIALAGIVFQRTFEIKNITIENAQQPLLGIDLYKNANIFLTSTSNVERTLQDRNPYVRKVDVIKKYPDSLTIRPSYYKPLAYFQVNDGYFLLSTDGRILEKNHERPDQTYPVIHYYQKFQYSAWSTGDKIDYKDLISSLFFLQKTLDLGIKINSIDINGLDMIALYAEGQKIIFTTEKEVELQKYQLESLIKSFKLNEKEFTLIDLRFNKPIIKLKN